MRYDKQQLEKDLLLYAVTDRSWLDGQTLAQQTEEALKGGVTFVQIREKDLCREEFSKEARELKALCQAYGVPFVVNDDVELAMEVDADGVHVGQSDMEAKISSDCPKRLKCAISTNKITTAAIANPDRMEGNLSFVSSTSPPGVTVVWDDRCSVGSMV